MGIYEKEVLMLLRNIISNFINKNFQNYANKNFRKKQERRVFKHCDNFFESINMNNKQLSNAENKIENILKLIDIESVKKSEVIETLYNAAKEDDDVFIKIIMDFHYYFYKNVVMFNMATHMKKIFNNLDDATECEACENKDKCNNIKDTKH